VKKLYLCLQRGACEKREKNFKLFLHVFIFPPFIISNELPPFQQVCGISLLSTVFLGYFQYPVPLLTRLFLLLAKSSSNFMQKIKTQFNTYLAQYIALEEPEMAQFFNALTLKKYAKNDVLLQQGIVCKYQFFILKGIVVASETDDEGNEHVIQIGVENSWIGDLASYSHLTKSTRLIKALKDCDVLMLSKEHFDLLLVQIPILEKLFRILFQNAYIAQTNRVSMMLNTDVKTRFELFKKQNPHLIGRVEWRIIASFLDMAPETLSRIKNQ
jgi:CRP-like cAMP-binding protein